MKATQALWVKEQLKAYGEISRNSCLKAFISRLGAIVQKLENEGYVFTTERRDGDYVYKLVTVPMRKSYEYVNEGGVMKPIVKMLPL